MRRMTVDRILLVVAIVLAILLIATWRSAVAQDNDVTQSNDQNLQTTGDLSVGGNRNLALGLGMGDVDIADCMYAKSTPVYQWGTLNKWCAADAYDRKGQHDNAARMRCSIRIVKDLYENYGHCVVMNTLPELDPDDDKPPTKPTVF